MRSDKVSYSTVPGTHIWPSTDGVPGLECRDTVGKFASRSCRFVLCCTRLCETYKTLAYGTAVPLGLVLGAVNPAGLTGVIKPNGLQPTECRNRAREPPIFRPSELLPVLETAAQRAAKDGTRRHGAAPTSCQPHSIAWL